MSNGEQPKHVRDVLRELAAQAPARAAAAVIAQAEDDRVPVLITPREHEVIAEVVNAIAADTGTPLYQRAGQLVHVLTDDHGNAQPKIVELPQAHLRTLICTRVRFTGERTRRVKTPKPTMDIPRPRRPKLDVPRPKRIDADKATPEELAAHQIAVRKYEEASLDHKSALVEFDKRRAEWEEAQEQYAQDVKHWRQEQNDAQTVVEDKHPPDWCVKGVAARGHWPRGVRPLDGFSEVPFLRPDGSVVEEAGYDVATRTILVPNGKFQPVPKSPTPDEARNALEKLLELVHDFPFEGALLGPGPWMAQTPHRSGWLAALLTPFARHAFRGPTPLFLVDANVRAAGKSKLTDCIAEIVLGRPMARTSQATHEEEERKRITSVLLAAPQLVLLDNIDRMLGSAPLDAVLTAEEWSDRILGKSDQTTILAKPCWYGNGNNVRIKSDTARRVQHIRITSPLENPEHRTGFRFPDLIGHVRRHRAAYVRAALTVLRAWYVAGAPAPAKPLRSWGSYERWSAVVRHAIVWLGEPDPGLTQKELELHADTESNALADLLGGWAELCKKRFVHAMTIGEALADLEARPAEFQRLRDAFAELTPTKPGQLPSAKSIGMVFHHLRERVQAGQKLVSAGDTRGAKRWAVIVTDESSSDESSSRSDVRDYGTKGTTPTSDQGRDQKNKNDRSAANRNLNSSEGASGDPGSSPSSPAASPLSPAPPLPEQGHLADYARREAARIADQTGDDPAAVEEFLRIQAAERGAEEDDDGGGSS